MHYAKILKLRFRVETWTCEKEEIGTTCASSRGEEEEIAQMCPCGEAVESRTHVVGECETYCEERNVLERR